jgi:uncharacterized protein YfiM (DUF2279 family)
MVSLSKCSVFFCVLLFLLHPCLTKGSGISEKDTTSNETVNKGRLRGVLITQGGLYLTMLSGLYLAWYKDYPQSSFHFFNDNGEWQQLDKCAHMTASSYITRLGYMSYRWAGVEENKAAIFGGVLSMAFMLNIEIMDGFSSGWGFSIGDFAANTAGAALFTGQQILWHEQRFSLKYSFHQTSYAPVRPDVLGNNLMLEMLKDYNGQSFWLSANISSFLPSGSKFPKWLNISAGYGAEGMISADPASNITHGKSQVRRFFLSPDVDLTRIRTKSSILKMVFNLVSFIKIPAPAIEFNSQGNVIFHGLYY